MPKKSDIPGKWKSKSELLKELNALRRRVAEFEQRSRDPEYERGLLEEGQSTEAKQCLTKPLTRTEKKVLHHILDGKSNKEIANLLNRDKRTIEVHRSHIMRKFNADNFVDLIKRAATMGLIELTIDRSRIKTNVHDKKEEMRGEIEPLKLLIDPGDATGQELAELFVELSCLYRMIGGSGINFNVIETREPVLVYA
jgi:DNA-binding CsgD family transcriptional regulator